MSNGAGSSDNVLNDCLVCVECGSQYKIEDVDRVSEDYLRRPTHYSMGYKTHCLMCWLGCGPTSGFAPPPP